MDAFMDSPLLFTMPFQDSVPVRRNLIVVSLAFIAFYWGGGEIVHLPDEQINESTNVRLHVINAKFSRTGVLVAMAWAGFLWAIYRYWLKMKGKFSEDFKKEVVFSASHGYVKRYVYNRLKTDDCEPNHASVQQHTLEPTKVLLLKQIVTPYVEVGYIANIRYKTEPDLNPVSGGRNTFSSNSDPMADKLRSIRKCPIDGWQGFLLNLRIRATCAFRYPSFSDYAIPYLLAAIALLGAAQHHVPSWWNYLCKIMSDL